MWLEIKGYFCYITECKFVFKQPEQSKALTEQEDDLGTTAGMASLDLSEPGSLGQKTWGTTIDDDEEITEVFEHAAEMDDVVDTAGNILTHMHQMAHSSSPHPQTYQRSYSVGGAGAVGGGQQSPTGELRKRSRNWSGTVGGNVTEQGGAGSFVSPRNSRRSRYGKSPVSPQNPTPETMSSKEALDSTNRQGKLLRILSIFGIRVVLFCLM